MEFRSDVFVGFSKVGDLLVESHEPQTYRVSVQAAEKVGCSPAKMLLIDLNGEKVCVTTSEAKDIGAEEVKGEWYTGKAAGAAFVNRVADIVSGSTPSPEGDCHVKEISNRANSAMKEKYKTMPQSQRQAEWDSMTDRQRRINKVGFCDPSVSLD